MIVPRKALDALRTVNYVQFFWSNSLKSERNLFLAKYIWNRLFRHIELKIIVSFQPHSWVLKYFQALAEFKLNFIKIDTLYC